MKTLLCAILLAALPASHEKALDALVKAPKLVEYTVFDGGDASVMAQYEEGGRTVRPVNEGFAIARLGPDAVKLLIEHLDDPRLTRATFRREDGKTQRVTAGFVALDILVHITADDPRLFIPECADDGLLACVSEDYSFRPDDFAITGDKAVAGAKVLNVQNNWRRAFKEGRVRYEYRD